MGKLRGARTAATGLAVGPTPFDDASTRVKLILTAERLFGNHGIEAVPLRLISKEAAQRNTNSVQYHFGGKMQLLQAIFELREAQLDPLRRALLDEGAARGRLTDVRWLLRVCFEPNFRHYRDHQGISYIRLHAHYLSSLRPRGIPHPVDEASPCTAAFREAIDLLHGRLAFLERGHFFSRLESVGTMFLGTVIQHAARHGAGARTAERLFEDILEMMTAAICTPLQPDHTQAGERVETRTRPRTAAEPKKSRRTPMRDTPVQAGPAQI